MLGGVAEGAGLRVAVGLLVATGVCDGLPDDVADREDVPLRVMECVRDCVAVVVPAALRVQLGLPVAVPVAVQEGL